MELRELLEKTRSIRRFDPETRISLSELEEMVSYARLCPSGGNLQPLRFCCVSERDTCEKIFENLKWAARLKGWQPGESEQPGAYVVILTDKEIAVNAPYDSGIAAHAILMAAGLMGYGGCMLGNVDRKKTASVLSIDTNRYAIDLVVALGKPAEQSLIEDCTGDTCYHRDENGVFRVPKQGLETLIVREV